MRARHHALAATVDMFLLSACTWTVPMDTRMPGLGIPNQVPLHATLFIPDSLRGYTFKGKDWGYHPKGERGKTEHIFPLGAELAKASEATFAQVFERVTVVRERPDPKNVEVLIEPEIANFYFSYDLVSASALAAASGVRVKVTMTDGSVVVWTRGHPRKNVAILGTGRLAPRLVRGRLPPRP